MRKGNFRVYNEKLSVCLRYALFSRVYCATHGDLAERVIYIRVVCVYVRALYTIHQQWKSDALIYYFFSKHEIIRNEEKTKLKYFLHNDD